MRSCKIKKIERQLPSGNQSEWTAAGSEGSGDARIIFYNKIYINFSILQFLSLRIAMD